MSFDLRKFLTENKLTTASRTLTKEDFEDRQDYVETEDGSALHLGDIHGTSIYSLEDSSAEDVMFYHIDGKTFSIDVAGEPVDPGIIKYETGLPSHIAEFIADDINKQLGVFENQADSLEDKIKKVPASMAKPYGADTVLLSDDGIKDRVDNILTNPKDLEPLKADIATALQTSRIRSKSNMLKALDGIESPIRLMTWFYNSILAKGGLKSPDAIKMREELEVNTEEMLDDQPVDRDPTEAEGMEFSFDPSKYESVEDLMKEIEHNANKAALQEKMKRVKAACESLEQKATALEEGEDSKYISSTKLKEMKRNAKSLRKMYEKYQNEYDKKYNEQAKPMKKIK